MDNSEASPLLHIPLRLYIADRPFRQVLISPYNDQGECRCLSEAVQLVINEDNVKAISHGISIPLHTPLIWLSQNLSYPDNFIHVSLVSCN
ncbi:hypothetical protein AB6A40_009205 [Gnathostoma spinigerum]|uniref:Autophagy protein 5 n=1 Tax=Gnathostoma spinigerum TaxID=75299 RepID=A0ABD6EYF0_9BILA